MPTEHEASVLAWRASRLARLTAPDGWLSLIGKWFLEDGVPVPVGSASDGGVLLPANRAPAQVGVLRLKGKVVEFTPIARSGLRVQRAGGGEPEPVMGPVSLRSDAGSQPDRLCFEQFVLEVMERGGTFAVRLRDLARAHADFAGIDCYPIDPAFRIVARLEPYSPERRIELAYDGGIEQAYDSPGALHFDKDGAHYQLDPVFESDRRRLWIVFGDATNRDTTYGAGRFLYAPLPAADGQVVLDFNCAFNPPCAFSPFVACPLPPFQNRLSLRVEAGEKRPRDHG